MAAVRVPEQADFDPVAYLHGLAGAIEAGSQRLYEESRAVAVDGDGVRTAAGHTVRCERVILATHMPFLDLGGLFARAEPMRSYGLTARLNGPVPQQMYLSADSPTRSLRSVPRGDGELLLVGGESHRAGSGDPGEHFDALADWGSEQFPVSAYEHRRAAHDFISEDGLPYVGPATLFSDRALTVTGLKNGAWQWARAARRCSSVRSSARRTPGPTHSTPVACRARHRSPSSPATTPKAACTSSRTASARPLATRRAHHLGCLTRWNEEEETWDCPCHGSRFSPTGEVLEGPATEPLRISAGPSSREPAGR